MNEVKNAIKTYEEGSADGGIEPEFELNELTKADKKKLNLDKSYSKTRMLVKLLFLINIVIFLIVITGIVMVILNKKIGETTIIKKISNNNKKNALNLNTNSSNSNKSSNNSLSNL